MSPCKWNDQWWSLVKAEKVKGEQHKRTKKAKRAAAPKKKGA